jgi:CAAX prenyl protease-like protein
MPFLALLSASILSKALSGGFEWLYPIRVVAALAVLWYFRKAYRRIDWRFGPLALAIGLVVLAIWIGLDRSPAASMSAELQTMPLWLRSVWIGIRILGAVVTVPIVEELAFRGFLLRRLVDSDFASVGWRAFPAWPVLASSAAFGAMHGGRWLEGTLAGVLYAWAMTRRGRLGDAVAAHAATNAMLAGWVLATGQWQYW